MSEKLPIWTATGTKNHSSCTVQLRAAGFQKLRESVIDNRTLLTWWTCPTVSILQQTWTDTGDVFLYRLMNYTEENELIGALDKKALEAV